MNIEVNYIDSAGLIAREITHKDTLNMFKLLCMLNVSFLVYSYYIKFDVVSGGRLLCQYLDGINEPRDDVLFKLLAGNYLSNGKTVKVSDEACQFKMADDNTIENKNSTCLCSIQMSNHGSGIFEISYTSAVFGVVSAFVLILFILLLCSCDTYSDQAVDRRIETDQDVTLRFPSGQEYREEAQKDHQKRQQYFEQANQAYNDGRRDEAKNLSNMGHMHTQLMEENNEKAVKAIIHSRNPNLENSTSLDLHGLYVKETIPVLGPFLTSRRHGKQTSQVTVITGKGLHSGGGKAKLRPVVMQYLKEHNYKFVEECTGTFRVTF